MSRLGSGLGMVIAARRSVFVIRDAFEGQTNNVYNCSGNAPAMLKRGDLNVGNDVRVPALFIARIHSS